VKWLRVIFSSELEHFLTRDIIMAEDGFGPDFQIFEIDHDAAISTGAAWREAKSRAREEAWGTRAHTAGTRG
jgi:hypothetical protein